MVLSSINSFGDLLRQQPHRLLDQSGIPVGDEVILIFEAGDLHIIYPALLQKLLYRTSNASLFGAVAEDIPFFVGTT